MSKNRRDNQTSKQHPGQSQDAARHSRENKAHDNKNNPQQAPGSDKCNPSQKPR